MREKINTAVGHGRFPDRMPVIAILLVSAMIALGGAACGRSGSSSRAHVLTVAGSTSVQPFAEKLAEEFMTANPALEINVQGGGSTAGVRAVITGAADIGMSSRQLKESEQVLHQIPIAYDGIAIIVHRDNPVRELSPEQIARIFAGEITRWRQVGGGGGEIHFVTREEGSGTRSAFEDMVMGGISISPRALVQDSNGAVREIVATDAMALGYISLGLVDNRVKALAVNGVAPTRATIISKEYAVVRPFLFLTRQAPAGKLTAFMEFVLGREGQRLLAAEGLVPVR